MKRKPKAKAPPRIPTRPRPSTPHVSWDSPVLAQIQREEQARDLQRRREEQNRRFAEEEERYRLARQRQRDDEDRLWRRIGEIAGLLCDLNSMPKYPAHIPGAAEWEAEWRDVYFTITDINKRLARDRALDYDTECHLQELIRQIESLRLRSSDLSWYVPPPPPRRHHHRRPGNQIDEAQDMLRGNLGNVAEEHVRNAQNEAEREAWEDVVIALDRGDDMLVINDLIRRAGRMREVPEWIQRIREQAERALAGNGRAAILRRWEAVLEAIMDGAEQQDVEAQVEEIREREAWHGPRAIPIEQQAAAQEGARRRMLDRRDQAMRERGPLPFFGMDAQHLFGGVGREPDRG
jgi:hypothetical protein